jgi:shikimate dehydrogenase
VPVTARRVGVLGWPVAHSRSPAMHEAAFRAAGLDGWAYQRLPVPPELFEETVRALPALGFAGANVTIPHKEAALALATEASDAARQIGAANTLTFSDGTIHADNTDAPAIAGSIGEFVDLSGATALVLGAGGSARAAVWALLAAGAEVAVWNRTAERAERLAAELGGRAVRNAPLTDVLVNCTAAGLATAHSNDPDRAATFKELPVGTDELGTYRCVVDLVYGDADTPFTAAAKAAGTTVIDGLEILVRQGALSFETWTGRAAPLDAMREGARSVRV